MKAPVSYRQRHRLIVTGLVDAVVYVLSDTLYGDYTELLLNSKAPYLVGEDFIYERVDTIYGPAVCAKHITGTLIVSDCVGGGENSYAKKVMRMSKPFKLSVNFKKPVQQNFLGCNAIYHGFAGLPDCDGRVYTPEQCELEADRAAKMGLKIARTYFKWYAYDQATHTWNWDNETMTAFYRWCERMQKRGIDIALHTGWCNPGDVNSSSWGGFSPFHVEGDWPQSVENYAAGQRNRTSVGGTAGFTNIKYLMFFTEPSRASGKLPAGKTAFECGGLCSPLIIPDCRRQASSDSNDWSK